MTRSGYLSPKQELSQIYKPFQDEEVNNNRGGVVLDVNQAARQNQNEELKEEDK